MTGLWEWYEIPADELPSDGDRVTWGEILSRWPLVLADLHQWYGIDLDSDRDRPWIVVRDRVVGLLTETRSRLSRDIAARRSRGA